MQKDPSRRFDDVAELAAALLPFAPSRALATAERAASLLAAARRASGKERISTLPSSVPAPWSERPIVADVRAAPPIERPARSWIRGIAAACVAATGLSVLAVASGLVRLPHAPPAAPETATEPAAAARPSTIVTTSAAVAGEAITMTSAVQTRPAAPPPAPRARRSAPRASAAAPPPPSASASVGSAAAAEPAAPPSASARAAAAAVELGY